MIHTLKSIGLFFLCVLVGLFVALAVVSCDAGPRPAGAGDVTRVRVPGYVPIHRIHLPADGVTCWAWGSSTQVSCLPDVQLRGGGASPEVKP